jgi:hypothetical protein
MDPYADLMTEEQPMPTPPLEEPEQPQPLVSDLYPMLGTSEIEALAQWIDDALMHATGEHSKRVERYKRIYSAFRRIAEGVEPGDADKAQVRVPLITWSTFDQAAKEFHAMYGEGARIIGEPANAETQSKSAKLAGAFLSGLVMGEMRIIKPLFEFLLYRDLFGRAYAHRCWKRVEDVWINEQGQEETKVWYDGPGFETLWPGDVIYPVKRGAKSVQDHGWAAIRRTCTVSEAIRRQQRGEWHGVIENLNDFHNLAGRYDSLDWTPDEMRSIKEEADGVQPDSRQRTGGEFVYYELYCERSLPLPEFLEKDEPVVDTDYQRRELLPRRLAVSWVPGLRRIVGCHDLVQMYPRMRNRIPIWESAVPFGDGYERPGLGDLLMDFEDELTSNERQFTDAVRLASMGFGFYKNGALPSTGFTVEPGKMYPVDDPSNLKFQTVPVDFQAFTLKKQSTLELVERITQQTDFTMGRSPDRPTQPRTATGQSLLIQAGSVRINVSLIHFNEDLSELLQDIWQMWVCLGDSEKALKLTESDGLDNLIDSSDGRFKLTPDERDGAFTFKLRFAATDVDKAIQQQNALAAYQAGLQNPLIATNPAALWDLTKEFMEAFGQKWFAQRVPRPIDPGTPLDPATEWALMLQGQDVSPNPADDDQAHYIKHYEQYQRALQRDDEMDADAVYRLESHIRETMQQMMAKAQMAQAQQQMQQIAMAASMMQPQPGQEQGGQNAPAQAQQF